MSDIQDRIFFQGSGLNSDDDIKIIPKGDTFNPFGETNRLNCSIEDGNRGTITNTKGNLLVTFDLPDIGFWKVIGQVYDKENIAIIYFLYNSQGNHSILRFFPNTSTFETIMLRCPELNFQENFKIMNPLIVGDGDMQLLYWTDGYFNSFGDLNPPRKINIRKALAATKDKYTWVDTGNTGSDLIADIHFIQTADLTERGAYVSSTVTNVRRSDDGGDSWGSDGLVNGCIKVQNISDIKWYALSDSPNYRFYESIDNGDTENQLLDGGVLNQQYDSFYAADDNNIFIGGFDFTAVDALIKRSTDGGASWTDITLPSFPGTTFSDVFAISATYAWATLSGTNDIGRTTNGTTWTQVDTGLTTGLHSINFVDSQYGWTCGTNGAIGKTIDGGVSWSDISPATSVTLRDIFFVDRMFGWVVGDSSTIFRTEDGGNTWIKETSPVTSDFYAVTFYKTSSLNFFGWAAGSNDKIIRYERLADNTESTYNGYDNGNFNILKPPPLNKPILQYNFTNNESTNFLRGKAFQFSYRYIYDDNEKSVWSTYSDVPLAQGDEFPNGVQIGFVQISNKIETVLRVDYPNIKKVDLAFRNIDVGSGVAGNWELFETIEVTEEDRERRFLEFTFKGSQFSKVLDQSDFTRNFDDVPVTSGHIELINENRIVVADNRKNYATLDIDISLDEVTRTIDTDLRSGTSPIEVEKETILTGNNADLTLSGGLNYNEVKIINESTGYTETYAQFTKLFSTSSLIDFFVDKINEETTLAITASNASNKLRIANSSGSYSVVVDARTYDGEAVSTNSNYKFRTMKSGSLKYLGLVYYDFGDRSNPVSLSSTVRSVEISPWSLNANSQVRFNYINGIKFTINHLPPSWATHYRWVISAEDIQSYYWVPIKVAKNYFEGTDVTKTDGTVEIDLSTAISRCNNSLNGVDLKTFTVQAGDYIRFIGFVDIPTVGINDVDDYDKIRLFSNYLEFRIKKVVGGSIFIDSWDGTDAADFLNGNDNTSGSGSGYPDDVCEFVFAEVFRKAADISGDGLIYQEVGDVLPIVNGFHLVKAENDFNVVTQDQNDVRPAIGVVNYGDAFVYGRQFIDIVEPLSNFYNPGFYDIGRIWTYFETPSVSSIYDSETKGLGRINFHNPEVVFDRYNLVQWGGIFSDNTSINDLSKFEAGDEQKLDDKYGIINSIRQVGQILVTLQERKMTSIDVGRTTFTNPDGTTQVVATNAVLGSQRQSQEQWGTKHPTSVITNKRELYFYDVQEGVMIRYAPNGMFPISDYKMKEWFRLQSKDVIDNGIENYDIYSGFDEKNGMLYVTFRYAPFESGSGSESFNTTNKNSVTLGFHESTNRWLSFYSFVPEFYGKIGATYFASFENGQIYLHNDDSVNRCTFYGEKFNQIIHVTSNEAPDVLKLFDALGVKPMKENTWSAPSTGDIKVFVYGAYPNDMISRLKAANFDIEEGEGWSNFLRDMRTSSSTANVKDLYNGRELRGYAVSVKLENSDNNEINLLSIQVNSSVSKT